MTPRQASLLSCCLALSRAAAGDCEPASKALRAFFDSPGPATAVFAADQVVASRGACVSQSRDGRRSTWFAAGDDGARDLRRAWCAPRRVEHGRVHVQRNGGGAHHPAVCEPAHGTAERGWTDVISDGDRSTDGFNGAESV